MRYRRAVRTVLMLVTAVLAAGCTTAVEGTPSAAPPAPLPVRPREVRLDGVDPCSLLTPSDRASLGLDTGGIPNSTYIELFRGTVPTCSMSGFRPDAVTLSIGTVTTVGIERWRESDVAATLQQTAISGFPAIVAVPDRFTDYCSVEIDVAHGQLLDVQFGDGGSSPPISQDELCLRASRSAEAAVASLLVS